MTDEKELAHQEFAGDLALHALGSLDAAAAARLEAHLVAGRQCWRFRLPERQRRRARAHV